MTNPFETLQFIAGGAPLPRCLHVVAEIGVADALDGSERSIAEVAQTVGANADSLRRILRLLAAHGVFEVAGDTVRHSPASELLRSDHPHSMRGFARMFGLGVNWNAYGELEHAVRTGQPAVSRTLPDGFFAFFQQNAEAGRIFNEAMVAKAQAEVPAIVAAYDFSRFRTVADIGGGRGHLIRAIVDANPNLRGVLFDLPHVVADAGRPSDRLTVQGGDFFKDALPQSDAYLVMEVIHDWPDAESLAILKAVRRAAPRDATLLLIEQMIPNDPGPHWSKLLDIHMLTLLGGKQRTRGEYEELLKQGGFDLIGETPTRSDVAILEARAV